MASYVHDKQHSKEHNSNCSHQQDMNTKVAIAVQSALKTVKNESLLDRFDKKSTQKTDQLDEISKEFKKSESMFKTAATHIESHIPNIEEHAKVIEKALHANDYFVDHAKDVNAIADEVLSKGCDEDLAAEFHHEFKRKTPIEIPVAEVTPYEPPATVEEPPCPVEAPPAPVYEYVPPKDQPTGLAKLLEESAGEDQHIPLNNIPVSLPEPVVTPAKPQKSDSQAEKSQLSKLMDEISEPDIKTSASSEDTQVQTA